MKKFYLLTLLCSFSLMALKANSTKLSTVGNCPIGDVVLSDQAEVDDFVATYSTCTAIEGVLSLGNGNQPNDISDISGLINITSIGGNLRIGNTQLTNLNGLNNVTNVGGALAFASNPNLTSLAALSSVTNAGSILVINNMSLTSLVGIGENFIEPLIQVRIINNPQLVTCDVNAVCGFINNPANMANVSNNAPGCDSEEEVLEACDFMVDPDCPEGDVILPSQAAVDFYVANFPNCTTINGTLSIGDGSGLNDITNISGLSNITTVNGNLIVANTALSALAGINNISNVGGNLLVDTNPNLTSLQALSGLTSINGFFRVENNNSLTSLLGAGSFPAIDINLLVLINNPMLAVCNLQNVCDYLATPNSQATIANNAAGCDTRMELEEICGPVVSDGCPDNLVLLTQADVNNFAVEYPDCQEIFGFVKIGNGEGPTNISDLTPLSNLRRVGGTLSIFQNPNLSSLDGLDNITLIGGNLGLWNNAGLTNMQGLNRVNRVGGSLNIHGNDNLIDFTGLGNLTNIGDRMDIQSNDALIDFSGLQSLSTVGGFTGISFHPSLTSLDGLESLVSIGGTLDIKFGPMLNNIDGLSDLGSVGGNLLIQNNGLTNVDGLSSLTTVGGNLSMTNNSALADVLGMSSLNSINGFLVIRNNDALTSLAGLEGINPSGISQLYIVANAVLATCDIENICTYLAVPGSLANVAGNSKECKRRADIEEACADGMQNDQLVDGASLFNSSQLSISTSDIQLYPNPTNGILQIRNVEAQRVLIINPQGQQVAQFNYPGSELDMSNVPDGVYYLNFLTAEGSYTKRVVKVN